MSSLVYDVPDFLSQEEIDKIKSQIYDMEDDWKSFSEYERYEVHKNFFQNKDNMQHVLGDAIYLIHTQDKGPTRDEINWKLRNNLIQNFDWLYQKLFDTIKTHFKIEKVEFDETLPVPGFHIFGKYEIEKTEFMIHQDSGILDYYPNVDENTIRSFVAVIQSSSTPAGLEIVFQKPYSHLSENVTYEYGKLYFWHGMIPHRIGSFSLKKDEYRITFQGHFYVEPNTNIVKVYF